MRSNENSPEYPRSQCIPRLFEARVEQTPDATAVVCGERNLSFRELNARANRLARHLRELGVGPEVPVGICIERSVEMLIGLLGILKAGGAYVPLDPDYPRDRLSFMLEDSRVPVLVCGRSVANRVPKNGAARVILDSDPAPIGPKDEKNLETFPASGNLAYVIYTSGSTGRPKGVAVEHRSVVNLIWTSATTFGFGPGDVWTVVHSFAFDFSVWEIWGCLCNGGRLIVVPVAVTQSAVAFYALLRRESVTILNQTPSALRNFLLTASDDCDLRTLNLSMIVCGGEAFPRELALDLLPLNIPLWNFYGPTEATVWATNVRVDRPDLSTPFVPLGRAMPNMAIYVLDEQQQPVPAGESGELYIGGDGLACGYLNNPDLTAEKFELDPFSAEPGARVYRTGDLARYRPDGRIEFLGRLDTQFGGRVTLFRAGVRSVSDAGNLDMGWGRLALGGVEIREVPGDHANMLLRPQVGLLAEQLRECIDKAIGAESEAAAT